MGGVSDGERLIQLRGASGKRSGSGSVGAMSSGLAARLGLASDARAVVVSCRGLGTCHASNQGVLAALRLGVGTAADLMVPCTWARHAARQASERDDIGVELTLNARYELYRWGPLTHAPSLVDGDGGFPRTIEDLWDHADLDEVRRECRTQIERASQWGVDVTHIGSYLSVLALRPEFFDIYLDLAVEFRLPVQLPPATLERQAGFPLRELADEAGVLHVDRVIAPASEDQLLDALRHLEPGVTELVMRPALDNPELRAFAADWARQVSHHRALVGDAAVLEALTGVARVTYRQLRDIQRAAEH